MKTYDVWKTMPSNKYLDPYYCVLYTDRSLVAITIYDKDELIQTGFKSYEAGLDFIQVLQKLKGIKIITNLKE